MFDKLKQMYELKKQADSLKKELEAEVFDVEHAGVKVRINAAQKILDLQFSQDKSPDNVKEAINKAFDAAQKEAAKKMQGMMGGLGGLQNLLK